MLPVELLPASWLAELGVGADGLERLPAALAHQMAWLPWDNQPLGNLALALLLPQILRVVAGAALPAQRRKPAFLRGVR